MAVSFLTAQFAYAAEFQNIFMAIQGAMNVRKGPNKDGKMDWFHAFLQGVVTSFAGGLLTPLWMGRSTPMLGNDLCFGSCIIAYILVNCIPFNIGYQVLNSFPLRVLTIMGAQLFRNRGILSFVNIAYQAFKETPSKYYPTPVFGPILNAIILGNMGSFFWKGFHGHLKGGMPFVVQNCLLVATTYHFVANDQGPIGEFMRDNLSKLPLGDVDPALFVSVTGSLFMQLTAILQMPDFLGASFNPFDYLLAPFNALKEPKKEVEPKITQAATNVTENESSAAAKKKKKNQKRKAAQKKNKASEKEKEL
jgi:hypothetical protein